MAKASSAANFVQIPAHRAAATANIRNRSACEARSHVRELLLAKGNAARDSRSKIRAMPGVPLGYEL